MKVEWYPDHRGLLIQAERLAQIVSGQAPDTAAVAAMRWRMTRVLLDHCAEADGLVRNVLLPSGDPQAMAVAAGFDRAHGGFAAAFRAYADAWPVDRISREWTVFAIETRAIIDVLARRIDAEAEDLHPALCRIQARRAAA